MSKIAQKPAALDWSVETNYPRTPAFRVVQPNFPGSGVLTTIAETDDESHARMMAAAPAMHAALIATKQAMWIEARSFWTMADFNNWAVVQQINEALTQADTKVRTRPCLRSGGVIAMTLPTLRTSGYLELYRDADEPTGLDIGGDEFPRAKATGTTFGSGFPDPAEWLAMNAPTGWLIEPATLPATQTKAA